MIDSANRRSIRRGIFIIGYERQAQQIDVFGRRKQFIRILVSLEAVNLFLLVHRLISQRIRQIKATVRPSLQMLNQYLLQ